MLRRAVCGEEDCCVRDGEDVRRRGARRREQPLIHPVSSPMAIIELNVAEREGPDHSDQESDRGDDGYGRNDGVDQIRPGVGDDGKA